MVIGEELMGHFLAVGPYLKEVFGRDVVVWISDTQKILNYFPGKYFDVDTSNDDYLAEDDPMRIAMQERKIMHTNMPKEMFGIPFKEVDCPIFDRNNNVIGCITVGISLEQETKIGGASNNINEAVIDIADSVKEIAVSAGNIRNSGKELRDNINEINLLTKEINKVLSFTKEITVQTNLLGLNAAIEAARAGEYGMGIRVVANEIRKLSIESLETAKNIELLIIQIDNANSTTLKSSE